MLLRSSALILPRMDFDAFPCVLFPLLPASPTPLEKIVLPPLLESKDRRGFSICDALAASGPSRICGPTRSGTWAGCGADCKAPKTLTTSNSLQKMTNLTNLQKRGVQLQGLNVPIDHFYWELHLMHPPGWSARCQSDRRFHPNPALVRPLIDYDAALLVQDARCVTHKIQSVIFHSSFVKSERTRFNVGESGSYISRRLQIFQIIVLMSLKLLQSQLVDETPTSPQSHSLLSVFWIFFVSWARGLSFHIQI